MQFVTFLGWAMFLCSIGLGIQSLYRYFTGTALEGFTTVILLQLLIGSVLMISLGIIGYYIAQIFIEVKGRTSLPGEQNLWEERKWSDMMLPCQDWKTPEVCVSACGRRFRAISA